MLTTTQDIKTVYIGLVMLVTSVSGALLLFILVGNKVKDDVCIK
ncbi:MAG: hypothetical protein ACI9C0_001534 [Alteromonadaceae bacterium]|jgi:hypothetical protein